MIERIRVEKKNVVSEYERVYDVEVIYFQCRSNGDLEIRLLIKNAIEVKHLYIIEPQTMYLKYKNSLVDLIKDKLNEYEETFVIPTIELKEWSGACNE